MKAMIESEWKNHGVIVSTEAKRHIGICVNGNSNRKFVLKPAFVWYGGMNLGGVLPQESAKFVPAEMVGDLAVTVWATEFERLAEMPDWRLKQIFQWLREGYELAERIEARFRSGIEVVDRIVAG